MTAPPQTAPTPHRGVNRRVATAGALGASLFTLLSSQAPHPVRAQITPVPAARATDVHPIRFTLSGEQTRVVFTPAAGNAPAHLAIQDESGSKTFAGDEITLSQHPALGLIASVLLDAAPDAYADYLSLLLPAVNPIAASPDVPIATLAIVTRHLTSIGGPKLVTGPLQTHDVHPVAGTAEFAAS